MRPHPRKGEDRLSDKKAGKPNGPEESKKPMAQSGKQRPKRASDIGRALRSVYDETLREDVPGDFQDLLRKLS